MEQTTIILNHIQINQKIKRIAYQIYEANSSEKEVVIAGIQGNGFYFSTLLAKSLDQISSLKISLCEVYIDKKNPLNKITTSIKTSDYENKSIVLVDDVLNSGTTLMYGIKHFLGVPLKRLKNALYHTLEKGQLKDLKGIDNQLT